MKLSGPGTLFLGLLLGWCCPAFAQSNVLSINQIASDALNFSRKASPTISVPSVMADINAGLEIVAKDGILASSAQFLATPSTLAIAADADSAVTETAASTTKAPQTAAEIIAEANALAAKYSTAGASATEEIVPDNIVEESPSEPVPVESTDPDLETVVGDVEPAAVEQTPDVASESKTVEESEPEILYEKADSLQPVLMVRGAPVDEVSDADSIAKLSGKIVPEQKPLGRRRNLYRWVLKTADQQRIPLKSNLKLLQEVKREKLLDGFVTLTGKFVQSGFSKDLRYFVVESAVIIDELPREKKEKSEDNKDKSTDKTTNNADTASIYPADKPAVAPESESAEKSVKKSGINQKRTSSVPLKEVAP